MNSLRQIYESLMAEAAPTEPWVVIINAGYGRQSTWPNATAPGVYSEEEARKIADDNNPSSQYHWHAKPLADALEYVTSGNKCYNALRDLQMQYEDRHDVTESANDYSDLEIGDPVIITGRVQHKGATGTVVDFDSTKSFVVVNLYNYGKESFHFTDVSYNDYEDSDEEENDMYDRDPDAREWAHNNDLDEGLGGYEYGPEVYYMGRFVGWKVGEKDGRVLFKPNPSEFENVSGSVLSYPVDQVQIRGENKSTELDDIKRLSGL